jgi:hypothetical protein
MTGPIRRRREVTYFIDDQRKWRISKSGFSIKTGWADEKKYIAKYPGTVAPLDAKAFQEWLDNAERICDLYNASLSPAANAEERKDALARIKQWSEAYPLEVFPEPDFKKANELLKAGGMTLDAISAANMRHVLSGIVGIVDAALATQGEKG